MGLNSSECHPILNLAEMKTMSVQLAKSILFPSDDMRTLASSPQGDYSHYLWDWHSRTGVFIDDQLEATMIASECLRSGQIARGNSPNTDLGERGYILSDLC